MKTINDISLYELMAEEHSVLINKDKEKGLIFWLENEEGVEYCEEGLHPCAAEGLAAFCRKYLKTYEKINREI